MEIVPVQVICESTIKALVGLLEEVFKGGRELTLDNYDETLFKRNEMK